MRRRLPMVLAVIVCLAGLGVLLYPTVSNWWNLWMQSRLISEYERKVEELDEEEFTEIYDAARIYNEKLYQLGLSFASIDANDERLSVNGQNYDQLLNINGNGVMGYVVIDKIGVRLAINHGTDDEVLHDAVGHLEGSSLPVGGENTHAALFGHRGLPSALLFTDLDQIEIGDYFQVNILGRSLNYQVDQILVVEPHETDPLEIEDGKDYVTLVTCTPYAVNTHRLLIRGVRVDSEIE
ncbi:MAG: class C sortase [Lachnospiraceae bacterium]|nr:class C sortase [Lachnospiraceae bacterium]